MKTQFRVHEYPAKTDKIIFVFTAMGTRRWIYRPFVWWLNRRGYTVVLYDYSTDFVLKPTLKGWRNFFDEIIVDAQERLNKYKKAGYQNFYSYGVSMGTLIANKFARDTDDIHHVILNLTYGDVARNIWTCHLVKKARKAFENQGIDEETLRQNIEYMNPPTAAQELKGKKVLLYLARHDHILIYEQTKETLAAFRKAKLDLTYRENKYFGHYINGAVNLMKVRELDDFYNS